MSAFCDLVFRTRVDASVLGYGFFGYFFRGFLSDFFDFRFAILFLQNFPCFEKFLCGQNALVFGKSVKRY